jgi:hypothetical protein
MLGRINVSTGLFVVQPNWQPVGVLLALFGISSLGPSSLAILGFLCTVVSIDTRIAAVPLVLNALKLGELQKVKPGRLSGAMGLAIVTSTVVAVLFTVWLMYNTGVNGMSSGGTNWALTISQYPFEMVQRNVDKLESMDMLSQANAPMDLSRLAQIKPAPYFGVAIGVGLVLVLVCSWLRLRFPGWPLHPLMFLVWGQPWMVEYAPSFLLAWFLKGAIMKYGGQRSYRSAKPAFVGLVAGEFLAALIWAVVGIVYYQLTGTAKSFLTRE